MLTVDPVLQALLRSSQAGITRGIASYQGATTLVQLEQSGSLTMSSSAQVQASTTVIACGVGNSLVPHAMTDPLGTYGQEMQLVRDVSASGQVWSIPLGVFRITDADKASERMDRTGSVVLDWSVEVTLQDRFEQINANDFLQADGPVAGNTAWVELQRMSPIPVQRSNLADQPVPANTVYDSRSGAITTLAGILGGEPALTRSGALTVRLASPWLTLDASDAVFDISGTISWSDGMHNDFYNQVVAPPSSDPAIYAYSALLDDSDPRSVNRAGGRTYTLSSGIYTTKQAAQAGCDTALARLLTQRSRDVTVECTPEALLLDLGDFGWMRDPVNGRAVLGEVTGITVPIDATQTVQVQMTAAVTEG